MNILKTFSFPYNIFLLIILINLTIFAKENEIFARKEVDLKNFFKEVRCLTCPGQSVGDSQSDFSIEVRSFIQEQYQENNEMKEIKRKLTEKYGEEILFSTPQNYHTILLWEMPFLCLVLGFLLVRKLTATQKKLPIN